MGIKEWPADERPREKLLARGAETLSDAELLAIFLRTGMKGRTAVDLARDLLAQFGSLRALLAADRTRLCASPGLGDAKYCQLQAALEMARRFFAETLSKGTSLTSPGQAREMLVARLRDRPHEVFAVVFLDNRHRMLHYGELFRGTIDGAAVHPREVVREALERGAAAVIFAHNHPSGVAEPSAADQSITRRLREALQLVDIRVLDHIVVGDGETVSFAERGLL
ncbi:MAG: DNA repair protein RadC [Proteobacteria bacterium]|nr:DNA repair protein RadC [Pseudomonadota bacterium]